MNEHIIIKAEHFDGQVKIILSIDSKKIYLYMCTTDNKIKGMFKNSADSTFTELPEQVFEESEEEWRY